MKEYFDKLIRHCATSFNALPICNCKDKCKMKQCLHNSTNTCYNCLTHIHQITTKDEHYACEKITYNYVLKHGYRYASEMAWAFFSIKENYAQKDSISVFSVGCGPCTELYGATAIFKNKNLYFTGFDLNPIWLPLQQFNESNFSDRAAFRIECKNEDFINYVRQNDLSCNILVLNYFLSDFVKYKPAECEAFITNLVEFCKEGRFEFIIINDIMLLYSNGTGYACMEKFATELQKNKIVSQLTRRHFAQPNEYQFEYGDKIKDSIGFTPIIEEAKPFDPFQNCGSIQLIIQLKQQTS